ncbi:MAG: PaaI family thioesterase [Deltaproteobacteria bacterium]|nr:PaaI family thioesterase [Deltaproteobacteria bacterium]
MPIEKLQGYNCFACGTNNPIGLNLEFYRVGDAVCADFTPGRNHEGWENMIHGGIVSTLLDEVMSWTVITLKKTFLVTRKMDFKYINPVFVDTHLTITGRILEEAAPPKITARGEIRNSENRLLVRGKGEFVMMAPEKLSGVPEGLKRDMLDLFNTLR